MGTCNGEGTRGSAEEKASRGSHWRKGEMRWVSTRITQSRERPGSASWALRGRNLDLWSLRIEE